MMCIVRISPAALLLLLGTAMAVSPAGAGDGSRSINLEFESPVLVSQGDLDVLDLEVDAYLSMRVPARDVSAVLASHERIARILESLIRRQAFFQRALAAGLLDEPENQARMYLAMLDQATAIYREHFREEIELESYETLARELYLTNRDRFRRPETLDLEQILIQVDPSRSETDAMREVLRLHELLNNGADFGELARSYSDDPTVADNGGVLENVNREDLVGPVRSVLDDAESGQWADPVRSQFGWHLVRVTQITPGRTLEWEEAQPMAEAQARQDHWALSMERLLRDIQDAPSNFSEGAIERLLSRHNAQPEDGVMREPELSILE